MPPPTGSSSKPAAERVNPGSLARSLFDMGALRFGNFRLPNGITSHYDIDLRLIPSFPETYTTVLAAYVELLEGLDERGFDSICGVATAGLTISSPLAIMLKKPMMYVRKAGESRSEGRLVEGTAAKGSKVLVVDDLVSSGSSLVSATEALRKLGFAVTDAAVLVDRLEGGSENLARRGVRVHSYTTIRHLMESLREQKAVSASQVQKILARAADRMKKN